MVDSTTVLWGQTIVYTLYVVAILIVMGAFAYNITRAGKDPKVNNKVFYSFAAFLVVLGVSLHIVTYNTIPWVPTDVHAHGIEADRAFEITVADHQFALPDEQMVVGCNDIVEFNVTSDDLTYGFGLFRQDNSMVFQMQVVPQRPDNSILWEFGENGVFDIRSTEYSGPLGYQMIVEEAVEVSGCGASTEAGGEQ
jgi:cytochrome c oxidase subunit II